MSSQQRAAWAWLFQWDLNTFICFFFLMSSALLCWYKLKYICSWQNLLSEEAQRQLRDLYFILFFFLTSTDKVTAAFMREKEALTRREHLSNKTSEKHGWRVFICPWRFCPLAFKVEQNKPTVPTCWSAYVKPGLQALSHSFISECLHTQEKSVRSQLWSQNIPTNLSPPASTHSSLLSTKCTLSVRIHGAALNSPPALPAQAQKCNSL